MILTDVGRVVEGSAWLAIFAPGSAEKGLVSSLSQDCQLSVLLPFFYEKLFELFKTKSE